MRLLYTILIFVLSSIYSTVYAGGWHTLNWTEGMSIDNEQISISLTENLATGIPDVHIRTMNAFFVAEVNAISTFDVSIDKDADPDKPILSPPRKQSSSNCITQLWTGLQQHVVIPWTKQFNKLIIVYSDKETIEAEKTLYLSQNELLLEGGQSVFLSAMYYYHGKKYSDVVCESSNEYVAKVSANGLISALHKGECFITVKSVKDLNISSRCKVIVTKDLPPLQPGDWIITTGEEEEWPAKGLYARNGDVLYNAEPSADKNGNTWTSLEYDDSNWTDIIGPLDNYKGNWTEEYTRYYVRRYFTVGDLSDIKSVKLRIAHDDDAIVYINGIKVANCPGYTDYAYREFLIPTTVFKNGQNVICINIYQGYGGCNLYFGLMGCDDEAPAIVSSMSFPKEEVSIAVGRSKKISPVIAPSDAFCKDMKWSSSNPAVATVDANGKVSALTIGTTVITAAPVLGEAGVSAHYKLMVFASVEESNSLPNVDFEFNYNAKDYDQEVHNIPNHDDAQLAEYNLQLSENIPVYDEEEGSLDIQDICCGWIDKWERESYESGEYFYRSGQDDMTIICKVAPSYNDREDAADFISNSAGGYNYMLRIGLKSGNSWFFLHTGHAYSEERSMHIPESDGQILAVRVNGNEDYILLENLTTHETLKVDNVNWGGGGNAFKFFYNHGGEYYTGKFFWVYYSKELLSDDDVQSVAEYNESYGTQPSFILGDANDDKKVDVNDVKSIANYLTGHLQQKFSKNAADTNKDGMITISDITVLIDLLRNQWGQVR